MRYEWYPDVFFLTSFLMDTSALLLAAISCNRRTSPGRILSVSAGAVGISMALLILLPSRLKYALLVYLVLHPLMTALAFSPSDWKEFLRLQAAVYVLLLLAGGIQESLYLQLGVDGTWIILADGITAMSLFVLWQVRQRVLSRVCAVDLWFRGEKISVNAYCDSGNLLRHPENGCPVSIADRSALPSLWIRQFPDPEMIPCRTVSDPDARMEVIALDKMDIYLRGRVREIPSPEIALCDGSLMQSPDVQLLLNAMFL